MFNRLLKYITIAENGCWEWFGCIDKKSGYGRASGYGGNQNAHRVMWIALNGPIESRKMLVCHKCDNRICLNPDHLFLGTHTDNARDMVSKGRHYLQVNPEKIRKGEKHHFNKLSLSEILQIKALWKTGHFEQRKIAKFYNIHQKHVSDIVSGKRWKHLEMGDKSWT